MNATPAPAIRRIVITGALGHIGSRLIRTLPATFPQAELLLIDNLATQRYCSVFHLPPEGRYRLIEGDVLDLPLDPLLDGADAVIHLAAITDAAGSLERRQEVERVNLGATRRLAACCAERGCPLIHLSSTSVYGTQQSRVAEDCGEEELRPQSPYAETKRAEEKLLESQAERLAFVTLRFGTICGVSPGMRFHTAVNKFCWQAAHHQPITVWRTALHQKRPYLDLEDAVRALAWVIQHSLYDGRIYNVATDNLTVAQIVNEIRRHVSDVKIEYVDERIMNQLSYEVARERFLATGFEYAGSIPRAIAETLALLRRI